MMNWSVLLADPSYGVVEPIDFDEQDLIWEVMRGGDPEKVESLRFYLVPDSIQSGTPGDILYSAGLNIFSERAVQILREVLSKFGLLVPVSITDLAENFYWYAVTNELDCLDTENSDFSTIAGEPAKIAHFRNIVLKKDAEVFDSIFRLPQGPYNVTFVGEHIVEKFLESDLTGFKFGGPDSFRV
jgi:hypothetical protein